MPLQLTPRMSGEPPTGYLHVAPDQIDCRAGCRRRCQPPQRAGNASRADGQTSQFFPSTQCSGVISQAERGCDCYTAAGNKKKSERPMSSGPIMDPNTAAFSSNVHNGLSTYQANASSFCEVSRISFCDKSSKDVWAQSSRQQPSHNENSISPSNRPSSLSRPSADPRKDFSLRSK
jgi:hypothetical protein